MPKKGVRGRERRSICIECKIQMTKIEIVFVWVLQEAGAKEGC